MIKKKSFCSICTAFCGLEVDIEGGEVVAVHPDNEHPMSRGFTCSKGRHIHHLINAEERVTQCQHRTQTGWKAVSKDAALDDIAERIKGIIVQHGPESVAVFCGNGVTFKALTMPSVHAFMKGLGSHQVYTSLTIDQPAKITGIARHGIWAAGGHSFERAKVLMLLGNNVFVSGLHGPGSIPGWRPGALKDARAAGLKLIVVDPRYTETARQSDLYLPIKPGTDAAFLSGVINWILEQGLEDTEFCQRFTEGLEELSAQVSEFSLEKTAAITGLDKNLIRQAAEMFVSAGAGTVSSATGPDMAPHANLSEHLIYSLNTLCGRHNRAGDKVSGSLLTPDFPPMEAVVPWDFMPDQLNPAKNTRRSRIHGAHELFNEMPTGTLADEILTPGQGQIKALIVIGGNPVLSIPEREKTERALESLDLCVCIDGRESATAAYADYLLPAAYNFERTDMTVFNDTFWDKPFHQVSQPLVEAPGEARAEHQFLAELAMRLGTKMHYAGGDINPSEMPDDLSLLEMVFPAGTTKVGVRELAEHAGGKVYEKWVDVEVIPAMEGMEDRLRFMPDGVAEEFALLRQSLEQSADYSHLLVCRRNPHVYNSFCHEFPQAPADNPAWLHPEDIAEAGLEVGQQVVVESVAGRVEARLGADDTLRQGVLAMTHGFGGPGGAAVASLLSTDVTTDLITRIPQMTAIPVRIAPL